jgi:hypothetical protein
VIQILVIAGPSKRMSRTSKLPVWSWQNPSGLIEMPGRPGAMKGYRCAWP